jgi:ComF family protein
VKDSTLKKLSSRLFGGMRDGMFAGTCFLCRGAARSLLCKACDADLPRLASPRCPCCALASPGAAVCGRCLANAPRYDATAAALSYDFPADALIHALKFRGELSLAAFLADFLGNEIRPGERIDCVVPVPLSATRLRERGYNQAVELARPLARAVGAPLELTLCQRTRDAPPQTELPWAERGRNVRGAFRCTRLLAGMTVAVVDDVMTTGATLDEIASTLKAAGAHRVVNWVVARTSPPN